LPWRGKGEETAIYLFFRASSGVRPTAGFAPQPEGRRVGVRQNSREAGSRGSRLTERAPTTPLFLPFGCCYGLQ